MRKISTEEFFEMVDIWYDEVDNTLTLCYEGNMAWVINGSISHSSNENVMFFSDHQNNKKIFMNTGTYDFEKSMSENVSIVEETYKNSMLEYQERLDSIDHECVDIEKK